MTQTKEIKWTNYVPKYAKRRLSTISNMPAVCQ
uniref:Uncharacterized protein n=1 Tax=Arundo donax TaxID=35708 RepID=A0A0A9A4Y9_ARUDO